METLGALKNSENCNDWKISQAKIITPVAEIAEGFQPILGRDLFGHFGIKILQKPCPKAEVNEIETPCVLKQSIDK